VSEPVGMRTVVLTWQMVGQVEAKSACEVAAAAGTRMPSMARQRSVAAGMSTPAQAKEGSPTLGSITG
jgi:hypothetical protein